jgi:hypothetical protein
MKDPSNIDDTKSFRKTSYDYDYFYEPTTYSFRKYSEETNNSERKSKPSKHDDY